MPLEQILTLIVLAFAFIGYVWCLSRLFWVTLAASAGLAFYVARTVPFDSDTMIYWVSTAGVFVATLLVVSLLPKGDGEVIATTAKQKVKKNPPEIVIDGTNVMYWDGEADLNSLRSVVDLLRRKDLSPFVFLDASSRHHLGDKSLDKKSFAKALGLAQSHVMVCPAQTEADAFILKFAKENSLPVISNDRFGDRAGQAKGLKLIKGGIAGGKPILHGL